MKSYRPLRVESLIREELSKIIFRELELETGTLATISDVKVSSDLLRAEVDISVIPSDSMDQVMKALVKDRGHFQRLLNHKMNIKPMPKIEFKYDFGLENAANVERLLLEDNK